MKDNLNYFLILVNDTFSICDGRVLEKGEFGMEARERSSALPKHFVDPRQPIDLQ
jgi:hypothetical protein